MNKEVEVQGLSMAATTSEGLEISLGSKSETTFSGESENKYEVTAPQISDESWKRAVQISDYYSDIGKLLPASTNSPETGIYYVSTADVFNAGQDVDKDAKVKTAEYVAGGASGSTTCNAATTLDTDYANATTTVTNTGYSGYYIDIPMWIRTNNTSDTEIYCGVKITSGSTSGAKEGDELMKAVRVAVIPTVSGNALDANSSALTQAYGGSYNLLSSNSSTTFGLTKTTWKNKDSTDAVLSAGSDTAYSSSLSNTIGTINTACTGSSDASATKIFSLTGATSEKYSEVGFIVRVWLEGESDHCWDATAGQDWNIDFYFNTTETDCKSMIS